MQGVIFPVIVVIVALISCALGALVMWALLHARHAEAQTRADHLEQALQDRRELTETFQALSSEALADCSRDFFELARAAADERQVATDSALANQRQTVADLLAPIKESLQQVDAHARALEASRQEAYGELRTSVRSLADSQRTLETETGRLVRALRSPQVRGRWGEMQLRRVVEIAGMSEHCDFTEQTTLRTPEGAQRPDLVVTLPGDKHVIVDAKAPLSAYLDAHSTEDDTEHTEHLKTHARHVRDHITKLGAKQYADGVAASPEFVVLFLPGEQLYSAALAVDPQLTEHGVESGVLLATPTTLIALLQTIAHAWRQERIAENAEAVSELGRRLYKRLQSLTGHMTKLGRGLDRAVGAYNDTIGSLESRVLVTARRFTELGPVTDDAALDEPEPIDTTTRRLRPDNEKEDVAPDRADADIGYADDVDDSEIVALPTARGR